MRSYPKNSEQSVLRLLVLVMLADGHLAKEELSWLKNQSLLQRFSNSPDAWETVLNGFCEDLSYQHNLSWTEACSLDNQMLKSLLQEVDDTDLQTEVFKLAVHLIAADEYISEKEFFVLRAMSTQWNIDHRAILQHNQRSTLSQEQQSVVALSLTS